MTFKSINTHAWFALEYLWYGIKKPLHLPHRRVWDICSNFFALGQLVLLLNLYIPVFLLYSFQALICYYALIIKNFSILVWNSGVGLRTMRWDSELWGPNQSSEIGLRLDSYPWEGTQNNEMGVIALRWESRHWGVTQSSVVGLRDWGVAQSSEICLSALRWEAEPRADTQSTYVGLRALKLDSDL